VGGRSMGISSLQNPGDMALNTLAMLAAIDTPPRFPEADVQQNSGLPVGFPPEMGGMDPYRNKLTEGYGIQNYVGPPDSPDQNSDGNVKLAPVDSDDSGDKSDAQKLSRSQFREVIGAKFAEDLFSENYSYDEIIGLYQKMYPEHAHKFTRNFCSKVRCGRIMNSKSLKQRSVKNGDARMKRITKVSRRKAWTRMTSDLFQKILEWEKGQAGPIKQSDIEQKWNVNRSTYHRWKKRTKT